MSKLSLVLSLVAMIVALEALVAREVSASPTLPTARRQAADLVKRAVALQQGNEHAAAIPLLAEAYAVHPDPVILFLKARSHMALAQYAEARDLYLAARRYPEKVGPTNMLELDRNLARCNEELKETQVTVSTSGQSGASLLLDGRFVGTSPLNLSLRRGTYTLRVEKKGYEMIETSLPVSGAEEEQFEVTLEPSKPPTAPPEVDVMVAAPVAPRPSGLSRTTWAWLAAGTSAVALGTGLGFLGDYGVKRGRGIEPNQHWEGSTATLAVGGSLTGVGLVLAATSIALFVTDASGQEPAGTAVTLVPAPGGLSLGVGGTW